MKDEHVREAAACPHCGSDDLGTRSLTEEDIRVRCRGCFALGPPAAVAPRFQHMPHLDEDAVRRAVELWNRRA